MAMYEPAIRASLASQTATTAPTPRQATNTTSSERRNQARADSSSTTPRGPPTEDRRVNPIPAVANRTISHPALEETPHRKQTRIRRLASNVIQQVAARFRTGRPQQQPRRQQEDDHSITTTPSSTWRKSHQQRQQSPNALIIPHPRHPPTPDRGENNRLLIHPALEEAPHRKSTRIRRQVEPRVQNQTTVTFSSSSEPETIP
jgi:hypothetical protein